MEVVGKIDFSELYKKNTPKGKMMFLMGLLLKKEKICWLQAKLG